MSNGCQGVIVLTNKHKHTPPQIDTTEHNTTFVMLMLREW